MQAHTSLQQQQEPVERGSEAAAAAAPGSPAAKATARGGEGNTAGESCPPHAPKTGFLRARGLPFAAGETEIRDFFQGFELAQVFICKRQGRSTGEAFVQLAQPERTQECIAHRNRQQMGHRYIELFEASETDMNTAKILSQDRLKGYVVRMRGLPFTASANDVLSFFHGVDIVRGIEGVIFTWTPDGRPTGEAFVELKDEEGQREAMKRHKELMGTRYIELFTSSKADLVQAIQHNRLILGFANRKRWLQQAGIPPHMMFPQPPPMMPHPLPHTLPPRSNMAAYMGGAGVVDEMSDLFSGMSMGGAAGMRGMQHPHMMAAGPGVRGGPMGFNNNPMGAAAVGGRGMGRGGGMGGAAGRGGGGGGFRPQLNSGLRAPFLSHGPGGTAGMMGRPMAPPAPANMRPHPSMLAQAHVQQAQQQIQQQGPGQVPLQGLSAAAAAPAAYPALLMQQQQQQQQQQHHQSFLRSSAQQGTLDAQGTSNLAPMGGMGMAPQDPPLFAPPHTQQQAQVQQQQQQQHAGQRPGNGPYMNMAAASPTYTLAIQMPPPGALPDTFQPQLSSGLDVSHPAQINSASIPISSMPMPSLSAGDMMNLARKQQEGSNGVVLPQ